MTAENFIQTHQFKVDENHKNSDKFISINQSALEEALINFAKIHVELAHNKGMLLQEKRYEKALNEISNPIFIHKLKFELKRATYTFNFDYIK